MATVTLPEVDRLDGLRLTDQTVKVTRVVDLTCGCRRVEAERPGGGVVHVIEGRCCTSP